MPRLSKIGAAALAAFGWTSGSSVTASYLVVAGGAGGGGIFGGGGGAGGLRTGSTSLNPTLSYTVTVGAGGVGGAAGNNNGANGSDSVFNAITSLGGGYGGADGQAAGAGGSGGGASGTNTIGAGTSGQGNNGGQGFAGDGATQTGGGGGGAGAVGATSTTSRVGGNGGTGSASSISGASVTYAGGGGGGTGTNPLTSGLGGSGGGGNANNAAAGSAGTANLGGGGGGGGRSSGGTNYAGGNGGSGIVIISYVGAQQFSGGTVSSSGGNTIHTFTTSGTLGPVTPLSANYLVVAGGGGGGNGRGGGGGAGGVRSFTGLVIDPYSTYLVTVGAGGAGALAVNTKGASGSDSVFSTITSAGGGGAGSEGSQNGVAGGSGGGAATNGAGGTQGFGGAGNTPSTSPVQGYAGGDSLGLGANPNNSGAGGGGAGGAGTTVTTQPTGGNGGIGVTSSISGTSTYYGGGGGGGSFSTSYAGGTGGSGGGGTGAGSVQGATPANGTANLGGGGGGSTASSGGTGGSGGAGVVIISYAGSTQLMAGGVVTIAGGNVIHTFNSSGYLTPLTLLTRSLRFRSSASAYLNRTFSTPTNNKIWTWSGWVKRGKFGVSQSIIGTTDNNTSSGNFGAIRFDTNDTLQYFEYASGFTLQVASNGVFRDPAAWYHIVIAIDTTQATAANRTKFYVNGSAASISLTTSPAQNYNTYVNSAIATYQSAYNNASGGPLAFLDGYLAEVNFIDGQALAPTAFGTFNSYGVWQPITYGGSYGTNGFRLPFTNNASTTTLGYDFSPQGNNWTTNNISVTAGSTYDSTTDVPTLTSATAANYAVMNPLDKGTSVAVSNGNLTPSIGSAAWQTIRATMAFPPTGKWYVEALLGGSSGNGMVGIGTAAATLANYAGADANGWSYNAGGGQKFNSGSGVAYGATYAPNDIIGVAFDADAGTLTFYKNNASQGVAYSSLTNGPYFLMPSVNVSEWAINFGQRPFSYTPPSGYVALNTFNL